MEKKGDKKPSVNLKIRKSAKKKKKMISLRVELKTFHNDKGG